MKNHLRLLACGSKLACRRNNPIPYASKHLSQQVFSPLIQVHLIHRGLKLEVKPSTLATGFQTWVWRAPAASIFEHDLLSKRKLIKYLGCYSWNFGLNQIEKIKSTRQTHSMELLLDRLQHETVQRTYNGKRSACIYKGASRRFTNLTWEKRYKVFNL